MQRDHKNEIVRNKMSDKVSLLMDWDADHASVVSKCSGAFGLSPNRCSLVRLSGGRVMDEGITENGCKHQWSLGRYIKTAYSKTTHPTLGILCESEDSEVY